jgi:hypothetical protein
MEESEITPQDNQPVEGQDMCPTCFQSPIDCRLKQVKTFFSYPIK